MFGDVKIAAKLNLKGNMTKGFLLMIANGLTFFLFTVYCVSCCYLFTFDTAFFKRIGVFKSDTALAFSCLAAVLLGFGLLLLHVSVRYIMSSYFVAVEDNQKFKSHVNFTMAIKALTVYTKLFFSKIMWLTFFLLPFALYSLCFYLIMRNGVAEMIYYTLLATDAVLLFAGLTAYYIYTRCYQKVNVLLFRNKKMSASEIIKSSIAFMNGRCLKAFILEVEMLPWKLLSLLVVPSIYCMPYCKSVRERYVSDNQKRYAPKTMHTEKSVVYYVGKPIKQGL